MSVFLDAQPEEARDEVSALLQAEVIEMALMLHLDFASDPVWVCNRTVPFVDLKWGQEWLPGAGLLVSVPNPQGGDGRLAPFREYKLGIPQQILEAENWAAMLVEMVGDKPEYVRRNAELYGQIFRPGSGVPVGHPFALSIDLMDRLSAAFPGGGAIMTLTTEGLLARKGVRVDGRLTYADQKRRHPTDEGLQFTTEAGKLIQWTDW